jgi:hypothetical protein
VNVRLDQHEPGVLCRYGVDLETSCGELAPGQAAVVIVRDLASSGADEYNRPRIQTRLIPLKCEQVGVAYDL